MGKEQPISIASLDALSRCRASFGRRRIGMAGSVAALTVVALGFSGSFAQNAPPAQSVGGGPNAPLQRFGAVWKDNCAGCHGDDLSGGRGPDLVNPAFLSSRSDQQIHDVILKGVANGDMPAFEGVLPDDQIWQLVNYIRIQSENRRAKPVFVADADGKEVRSEKQAFRIDVIARGLDTPWGMTFLPDGRMLVTERAGRMRVIDRSGRLLEAPVTGLPTPWVRQDAGFLDVIAHPQYKSNGWIYLAYTELVPGVIAPPPPPPGAASGSQRQPGPPSMTVIIRGRLDVRNRWTDTKTIFRAPAETYTGSGSHYGARLGFDRAGRLFFSIGERGEMSNAQRLDTPLGKIHRVNADGSIPADNPFVGTPGAVASIWSYGHRNPQGLAWDPATGILWSSEHGPVGGDEINIIEPGKNYGWGQVSMGIQPGIAQREAPGMELPIAYFTPALAPSGISFYTGDRYKGWKGNLFVAALVGQQLRRMEIKGRKIEAQEILFQQFGRIRTVQTGPDGLLYVLMQTPTGSGTGLSLSAATPGLLVRLTPVE